MDSVCLRCWRCRRRYAVCSLYDGGCGEWVRGVSGFRKDEISIAAVFSLQSATRSSPKINLILPHSFRKINLHNKTYDAGIFKSRTLKLGLRLPSHRARHARVCWILTIPSTTCTPSSPLSASPTARGHRDLLVDVMISTAIAPANAAQLSLYAINLCTITA